MTIEVEGPNGEVIEFPDGTAPDVMKGALAKHFGGPAPVAAPAPQQAAEQPAPISVPEYDPMGSATGGSQTVQASAAPQPAAIANNTGDQSAAIGRGLINGIPVAGPYILGGVNRAVAGIRSLQSGTPYADELKNVEGFGERTATANPGSTFAGEMGGAILGTAPMIAAAPAAFGASAAPMAVRMGASALTGAGLGGADAAVRSGGDLDASKLGAAIGGIGGFVAPGAAAGLGKIAGALASRVRPAAAIPSTEEISAAATRSYQAADDAGVRISQPSFSDAVKKISATMQEAGIDKTVTPKAMAAIGRLEEAAGTSPTLRDVDMLRRVASGAAGSIEKSDSRIGSKIVSGIDDYVGGLKAADVVAGNPEAGVAALTEARGLWSRAAKAEQIAQAVLKAERRAGSTGSGGNADNAIRQNIRAILDSPTKSRGFTDAEKAVMETIVRGGKVQNIGRLVGKLSPSGNGLMAALNIGAVATNPLMAIPSGVGIVSKALADRTTVRNADLLDRLVRSGGNVPQSRLALPARQNAERIARILSNSTPLVANQRRSAR